MNPYEPSQTAELQTVPSAELITSSPWPVWRTIFQEWEQRRLIYNVVLIAFTLVGITRQGWGTPVLETVFHCLWLGFAANCAYFAGPLFESYVSWLQGGRVRWGTYLFLFGLGFSLLIAFLALLAREFAMSGA